MVVYIKKVQLINYSVHVALQWISGREGCIKQLSRVSSESVMGYFNPRLGQWSTDYLYNCRWSASTQDSRNRIQEGLARLEQWSEIKRMQFNKDKHEVATISCTGINGTSSWVQSHRRESSLKKKNLPEVSNSQYFCPTWRYTHTSWYPVLFGPPESLPYISWTVLDTNCIQRIQAYQSSGKTTRRCVTFFFFR